MPEVVSVSGTGCSKVQPFSKLKENRLELPPRLPSLRTAIAWYSLTCSNMKFSPDPGKIFSGSENSMISSVKRSQASTESVSLSVESIPPIKNMKISFWPRAIGTSYPKIATNFKSFYVAEIFALLPCRVIFQDDCYYPALNVRKFL